MLYKSVEWGLGESSVQRQPAQPDAEVAMGTRSGEEANACAAKPAPCTFLHSSQQRVAESARCMGGLRRAKLLDSMRRGADLEGDTDDSFVAVQQSFDGSCFFTLAIIPSTAKPGQWRISWNQVRS